MRVCAGECFKQDPPRSPSVLYCAGEGVEFGKTCEVGARERGLVRRFVGHNVLLKLGAQRRQTPLDLRISRLVLCGKLRALAHKVQMQTLRQAPLLSAEVSGGVGGGCDGVQLLKEAWKCVRLSGCRGVRVREICL